MNEKVDVNGRGKDQVAGLTPIGRELIGGVPVALEARLGKSVMTIESLLALKNGSVVTLETGLADQAELYLNDALVARGEIVAAGDNYAIRIIELASEI
ncbi:MAG TPA: FliM/FliN family flagellar motor switch protein [Novosphingobium sp.]